MAAQILKISQSAYHDDPCDVPSLSSSVANVLISKSPLHAWAIHPKLGRVASEGTKATTTGTLLHELILGGNQVIVLDVDDYKTKAAQQMRDAAIAAGKTPVKRADYEEAEVGAGMILDKLRARGVELTGDSEVVITWESAGGVRCRAMMDHVFFNDGVIYDVKSTEECDPDKLARHIYDYGYHIQRAAYVEALEALRPEFTGRVKYQWLFIEPKFPHDVLVADPDGAMVDIGRMQWAKAVEMWGRCLAKSVWPGRTREVVTLETSPWQLAAHEKKLAGG